MIEQNILDKLDSIKIDHLEKKIVQNQEKKSKGKYKHIKKQEDKSGTEYSVNEYLCPNGETGFDIFFYRMIDGVKYYKTIGYGEEAYERTQEWTELTKLD